MQTVQTRKKIRAVDLLRSADVTVARLTLDSYLRSGWLWGEFALVVVLFAILYFPFSESTSYFNGTSMFCLGGLAILGPALMVRQATSARTYLVMSRLTSRAAYSRGLMLAAAVLRIPLYLFFLLLVLLFHRLTDPAPAPILWGMLGLLPAIMLVAVLTVGLCAPMATRWQRILFLTWLAVMLFSYKPPLALPNWLETVLSLTQLSLWPLQACYTLSFDGSFSLASLLGLLLVVVYAIIAALVAGYWLEKRELLFH